MSTESYRGAYRNGGGERGFNEWQPNAASREVFNDILAAHAAYREQSLWPTKRDIFYDLVGLYGYKKSEALYRKVLRLIALGQRSLLCDQLDFRSVRDDSYDSKALRCFSGPEAFYRWLSDRGRAYRKDLMANQPLAVEVVCEGAGRVEEFFRVTARYAIPVYSPGGWDSVNPKFEAAQRVKKAWQHRGKPTVMLLCGDLDPDGIAREAVFEEDVRSFLTGLLPEGEDPEEVVSFKRVMALPEQISEEMRWPFSPPPPTSKNHRAKAWPLDFTAQMEAIPMSRRLELLRQQVEALLDWDQLSADREAEPHQRDEITEAVARLGGQA